MIPAKFDYVRADSADAAVSLLAEHGDDAKLLAGGHSLLPLMKQRLATPAVLVDVGRIRELSYVRDAGSHVAIGALTRHRDVETVAADRRARAVARARGVAGRRSAGAPPRHARRVARARRPRVGPPGGRPRARGDADGRRTARRRARSRRRSSSPGSSRPRSADDEMLVEVRVPKMNGSGWSFQKFQRRAQDWAIVGVRGDDGRLARRRVGEHGADAPPCAGGGAGPAQRRDHRRRRGAGRRRYRAGDRPQRRRRAAPSSRARARRNAR